MAKYYFVSYQIKTKEPGIDGELIIINSNVIIKNIHPLIWASSQGERYDTHFINYVSFYNEIPEDIAFKAWKLKYIDCDFDMVENVELKIDPLPQITPLPRPEPIDRHEALERLKYGFPSSRFSGEAQHNPTLNPPSRFEDRIGPSPRRHFGIFGETRKSKAAYQKWVAKCNVKVNSYVTSDSNVSDKPTLSPDPPPPPSKRIINEDIKIPKPITRLIKKFKCCRCHHLTYSDSPPTDHCSKCGSNGWYGASRKG